jgi:hypothetical protein
MPAARRMLGFPCVRCITWLAIFASRLMGWRAARGHALAFLSPVRPSKPTEDRRSPATAALRVPFPIPFPICVHPRSSAVEAFFLPRAGSGRAGPGTMGCGRGWRDRRRGGRRPRGGAAACAAVRAARCLRQSSSFRSAVDFWRHFTGLRGRAPVGRFGRGI